MNTNTTIIPPSSTAKPRRIMRCFWAKPPNDDVPGVVKRLFEILHEKKVSLNALQELSGLPDASTSKWRFRRQGPNVAKLDRALRSLGYKLAVVKLVSDQPEQ